MNELNAMKSSNRTVLETSIVLLAPFCPHFAEEVWESID
jgi:leucyl-tRNA synthetase